MAPTTRLQLALGALATLQALHLLDELRTDDEATFPGVLLTPQAILGIGGALTALVLVGRGHRLATRLATVVASLVVAGFVLVHGIPVASERTEPYWGDGSADVVQWVGVLAVLAAGVATVRSSRRQSALASMSLDRPLLPLSGPPSGPS